MALPSVVLPEPDSPTKPSTSPSPTAKVTPSTAGSRAGSPARRWRLAKATTRSSISIRGGRSAMVNAPHAMIGGDMVHAWRRCPARFVGLAAARREDAALRQAADARHLAGDLAQPLDASLELQRGFDQALRIRMAL